MLSLKNYGSAEAAVIRLLRSLQIPADEQKIISELERHPDYPSLLAVSDVLTNFHIANAAYRVGFDELSEVSLPFLAHTSVGGGDLALVKKTQSGVFHFSESKKTSRRLPAVEFEKIYRGVVLVAEPSEYVHSRSITKQFFERLKMPALIAGILLIFSAILVFKSSFPLHLSLPFILLAILKTTGLAVALLLLMQSIDTNNPLIQVLCQTEGKTNCNAILSSKAAKAFEGLSWSEVGFFYFAGTWLLLLFGGNSPFVWDAIELLNFVSLPYTFYSIYYQWRIAKQWCVLCCSVQAILWLEFFSILPAFHGFLPVGLGALPAIAAICLCLLSPVIVWMALKPLLIKLQQIKPLKDQLRQFKYNAELFNKMLSEQPRYALPERSWSIVLGNQGDAVNVITMVSNPYCPPCSKTHKLLDDLLNERTDLQARIVFTANNDERDRKTPISRHLMALNDNTDKITIKKALHDWYEQKQKSYQAWAKLYPVEINENGFYKIDRQSDWCNLAAVSETPTLLLNGYRLPSVYQLPDIKYMLE